MSRSKKIGPTRSKSDKNSMYNDYIALIDYDFTWDRKMVKKVIRYWRKGFSIEKIAIKVNRIPLEVTLLIMDLAEKEKIEARKGGLFGSREDE